MEYRPRPERTLAIAVLCALAGGWCAYGVTLDGYTVKTDVHLSSPASNVVAAAVAAVLWWACVRGISEMRRNEPALVLDAQGVHVRQRLVRWDEIRSVEARWSLTRLLVPFARRVVITYGTGETLVLEPGDVGTNADQLCREVADLWHWMSQGPGDLTAEPPRRRRGSR